MRQGCRSLCRFRGHVANKLQHCSIRGALDTIIRRAPEKSSSPGSRSVCRVWRLIAAGSIRALDVGHSEWRLFIRALRGAGRKVGWRRVDVLSALHNIQIGADVHMPLDVAMVQPHSWIVSLHATSLTVTNMHIPPFLNIYPAADDYSSLNLTEILQD